ncbi:Putative beta-barrel porin-2, OmpL-like. bbp2 [Singulisphaera sp. GP187]|uniref:outer membrane beta-barrel protein n=1 Tax=Singulisphaera sp. GP187 TaxID=1882752 RepID=UPI000926D2B3|nr:outer membrane beta-barrel protein [Singulisphaera sp. GP187]SIO65832.1 Putative beta-barrel porin-2, OmpL-like. bbp2 [Singulisphaera sp. GP187]
MNAQEMVPPGFEAPGPPPPQRPAGSGLQPESLPAELAEDVSQVPVVPSLGSTPVSDVRFLMDTLGVKNAFGDSGIRTFGWVEGGYTGSSSGSGLLSVEPRQNRFGNEFLLNQIGLVIQKPLKQDRFDIGFNVRYFAGADAALGQPKGGIDSPPGNSHFSHDFRDLYISAHLPIFTEGGMDVKVGRMNTIIGYNGFLAPYRPFYSSDYQFFYSQDGAFTGFLLNQHVTSRLDIWSGMTLGANTFFTLRSNNSYCYIGQVNYWLTDEQKTRLTASVYTGPNAIFAAPGMAGDHNTTVELRVQQNWSERFVQIVQSNMGWDTNTPVGTGSWYGLYTIGIYHLAPELDIQGRAEWFDDVKGTRTGINTDYAEVTLGLNWHPNKFLEVRPEIRGDFAGQPAFGGGGEPPTHRSQLTGGISALIKF